MGAVLGALPLEDGRILSWSMDKTLRLWDGTPNGHYCKAPESCERRAADAQVVVLHPYKEAPPLWGVSGRCLSIFMGHSDTPRSALPLPVTRAISWADDGTLRFWDLESGECLQALDAHEEGVQGAMVLERGRILSWSRMGEVRLWDAVMGAQLGNAFHTPVERQGNAVLWSYGPACGLLSVDKESLPVVAWNGDGRVSPRCLRPDGRFTVAAVSGRVFDLRLFRGARRISLKEYEAPAVQEATKKKEHLN